MIAPRPNNVFYKYSACLHYISFQRGEVTMSLRINSQHQTPLSNIDSQSSSERTSDFSGVLSQTQKIQRIELQTFLDRLETQGKKLAHTLSISELKDFRDMVKTFLRSTLGQSRKMQEDSSWDSQGRPKVMARIAKIDKALDELGKQLLDQQAKPLEVLTKIDEIRGLIVDLFA
jgi:uncharacterized protein YaaR (DUF327 family)